ENERSLFRSDVLDATKQGEIERIESTDQHGDRVHSQGEGARVRTLDARGQDDCADAVPGPHQAVCVEFRVGGTDGVDVDAELPGEVTHRWESIAGRDVAVGDQKRDPGADLSSDSNA